MARVRQTVVMEVSWDPDQDSLKDPSAWAWQSAFIAACKQNGWVGRDHVVVEVMHGGPVTEVEGG